MKKKALILVLCLALLFAVSACGAAVEKPVPTVSPAPEPTESPAPAWEICTVRVIYGLLGSEVYVLHADGTCSMYITPHICDSLSSFTERTIPFDERKSGSLPETEREELRAIVSSVYADGEMLPVGEPYESLYAIDCSVDVYISIDGSEEAHILKNYTTWEGYPTEDYEALIRFLKQLDPESPILRR